MEARTDKIYFFKTEVGLLAERLKKFSQNLGKKETG